MTWVDVLGWAGMALLVLSLLQSSVIRLRLLSTAASVELVFFNAMIGVWSMVAMNAVLSGINLWYTTQLLRERGHGAAYEVLRVSGTSDDCLQHMLTLHGNDIRCTWPLFSEPVRGDHAFLVVRGDEIVGVVIVRGRGGTARVTLDYVTPKYRDSTPGEFVWRRSGLLNGLGFTQVVATPPEGFGAYYTRIGFRRNGSTYVLDL